MVKFRKSPDSLAGKLIFSIGLLMTAGSVLFGYIFIMYEREAIIRDLSHYAAISANIVKGSLHYGMLTAQSEAIKQTINLLGADPDVKDIKVADSKGRTVYASDKTLLAKPVDPALAISSASEPRIVKGADGQKVLRLYVPILNEPPCYTAACHAHPAEARYLGFIEISFSAAKVEEASTRSLGTTLFFGGLFVLSISVFLCIIIYKFVSKPVALLEEGMQRLSKGDFEHPIDIPTKDEMGLLARSFNEMAQDIKRYREHMEDWTRALQEEVDRKTAEIIRAQEQFMDAEKLASLGRMAAGIAHEINNPLTGIITFTHLLKDRIPPERKQDAEDLDVIIEQAERCSRIIKGLLGFARKGAFEKIETSMNELLESTVFMIRNQAEFHNIQLKLALDRRLPTVTVDPNQMRQVFLNMLTNAVDAMDNVGTVILATRMAEDGNHIAVEFTDTGHGISAEDLGKIFEPFYTTKPVGKGTGLGLPVSYGIVKKHGGEISVQSEVGRGTTFTIKLPVSEPGGGPPPGE